MLQKISSFSKHPFNMHSNITSLVLVAKLIYRSSRLFFIYFSQEPNTLARFIHMFVRLSAYFINMFM